MQPVEEVTRFVETEPVAEVSPIAEVAPIKEQPEFLDDSIAEIAPCIELFTETSAPLTDWVPDNPIAGFAPVERVESEPTHIWQAPALEDLIPEAIAEPPAIAPEDLPVEPEAIADLLSPDLIPEEIAQVDEEVTPDLEASFTDQPFIEESIAPQELTSEHQAIADLLLSEEISPDLEEITPPQEIVLIPEAIALIVDDGSPIIDEASITQDHIQHELESAMTLLEEPTVENLTIEPTVEELIVEEPIVEELIPPATFTQPIPPFSASTLNTDVTDTHVAPQDFFPESLALTDVKEIDSESFAEIETIPKPEILDIFDLPELDTVIPESPFAPENRETYEPRETFEPENLATENLATDHIPLVNEVGAAESAIESEILDNHLYPRFDDDPTIHISTVSTDLTELNVPVTPPPAQPIRAPQSSPSNIVMGTAIALFGLLSSWYILSRPCVLGSSCKPLEQAQQISKSAFQTVQSTDSAIAIAKAYDDLGTANKLLKSIPSWSGQYQAAQTLSVDNKSKSVVIGQVVRTLRKGNEAANRSQNPPHPLPEWREIQRLWRESIVALEKIPSNSAIYPLAQRKATEYRANLDSINKRVVVEQQAQEEVENAKKTAQLAETRTGIATSAAGWQDVYTSWQAAIGLLKNVPKGAAARLEAEELLKIYQNKLVAASTRRDQENTAITAYIEAIAQAEQAQSFERKNQWQPAIARWESALANVQKVAQGTVPYSQAQPLIATYQTALTQAQGGLRISEAIQAAKPALDRTCGSTPKVCQYDAASTAIRVQITYGYDQMVESAMTSAQSQGNSTAQAGIVSKVNTFLQELALISQTSQVPIELYNANGSKFGTYSPEAAGFVPQ